MNFNKLRYFLKISKDHLEYPLEMEYSICTEDIYWRFTYPVMHTNVNFIYSFETVTYQTNT